MRLLVLGGVGQYPERLSTFVEAGHRLWYASSHPHHQYLPAIREHLAGIRTFDLDHVPADRIARLQRLIEDERIDIVYSLLNAWEGSNQVPAGSSRPGRCTMPGCFTPLLLTTGSVP